MKLYSSACQTLSPTYSILTIFRGKFHLGGVTISKDPPKKVATSKPSPVSLKGNQNVYGVLTSVTNVKSKNLGANVKKNDITPVCLKFTFGANVRNFNCQYLENET